MSYLGFVKLFCDGYLKKFKECPRVLEIGVDRGQTTLPLVQNLSQNFERFSYVGVDIKLNDLVIEQLTQFSNINVMPFDEPLGRDVAFLEANSIDLLERAQYDKSVTSLLGKFDAVFIDGDHNYDTVTSELHLIQAIVNPDTIIICDDYNGRWAEKDLYYSERETHRNVSSSTPRPQQRSTSREGVRTAINDFIQGNSSGVNWAGTSWPTLDPAILYNYDIWEPVDITWKGTSKDLRDQELNFNKKRSA